VLPSGAIPTEPTGRPSTQAASPPFVVGRTLPRSAACPSASRFHLDRFGVVVQVRRGSAVVTGLVMNRSIPPKVGDQIKIVWRITGTGQLSLSSHGPGGRRGTLLFGPELHTSSNFTAPGAEWGSGFQFGAAGCWRIAVRRGPTTVVVTLPVVAS
jgi:hypothetical protein